MAQRRLGADAWPFLLLGAVTVLAAVCLGVAARVSSGRLRWAWGLLSVASCISAYLHTTLAWTTDPPGSIALRLAATLIAGAAIVAFPGTERTPRRWLLLGLDGWLIGGSLFIGLWLFSVSPARLDDAPDGLLVGSGWVLIDLALASVVFALTRRLPTHARAGGIALSITAALMTNGDLYRAFFSAGGWGTTGRAAYLGSWTAAVVIAAATPWIARNPFAAVEEADARRGAVRLPYVAACLAIATAVLGWTLGRPADPMLAFVVLTLLASILTSQTLLGVENARLVRQMTDQAESFRDRATRDQLTGLPNRGEFTGRVEAALRSQVAGRVAVLFLDLDGFKDVNDSFGHAVGDELLVEAAGRLSHDIRERDVVARFGGDEFVALLTDCSDAVAAEVAERLRTSLSRPYLVAGREIVVSASIGLARPGVDDDAESALRNADLALYRAKSGGRDRVAVYEPAMHASALRRLDGAARLRQALSQERLLLAYQPIVDLRTGAVYGMEALLRFDGSDLPGWSVADAVAAAEESGLIVPIGRWVLESAVAQLGEWNRSGHRTRIAVNVSARQLEIGDVRRRGGARSRDPRRATRPALPRDHRAPARPQPGRLDARARAAAAARGAYRVGRLRDGLLVAVVPAPASDRLAQGRSRARDAGRGSSRHGARRAAPRTRPGPDRDGRGDRDRRPVRPAADRRLHARAGLSARAAARRAQRDRAGRGGPRRAPDGGGRRRARLRLG